MPDFRVLLNDFAAAERMGASCYECPTSSTAHSYGNFNGHLHTSESEEGNAKTITGIARIEALLYVHYKGNVEIVRYMGNVEIVRCITK